MVLIIDNFDSFTWNLVAQVAQTGTECIVKRNDAITLAEAEAIAPAAMLISPGPGRPADSGISTILVNRFRGKIPILGVCLGHQLLGELLGGIVLPGQEPVHGKTSPIHHDKKGIFGGMPDPFRAMRYHSLIVEFPKGIPEGLEISARTDSGEIMGLRVEHEKLDGLQFHPESILTEEGDRLIGNWLRQAGLL